jgi:hypothetical protein
VVHGTGLAAGADGEERHGAGADGVLRDGLRDSAGEVHEVQRLVLDPRHLLLDLIHILLTSLASCFGTALGLAGCREAVAAGGRLARMTRSNAAARAPCGAGTGRDSGQRQTRVPPPAAIEVASGWKKEVVAWAKNRRRKKKRVLESFH